VREKRQSGFTLIEVMIVLAIIGILAALAVPTYHHYVVRAKVTEVFAIAGPIRLAIGVHYSDGNMMPADLGIIGLGSATVVAGFSSHVGAFAYSGTASVATLTFTLNDIGGDTLGKTMIFQGTGTGSGITTWDCSSGTLDSRYLPPQCR